MKLAVFFPASLFSAWACSYGLVDCLRRMGHEVTGLPVDPQKAAPVAPLGRPEFDGVIISGPEHIGAHVTRFKNVPTIAWLHETVEREDFGKMNVDTLKYGVDIVFCPGIQDEKYGFRYLPFGVDTEIFKPTETVWPDDESDSSEIIPVAPKSIDAAFIGLLYPKRLAFLKELKAQGVNLVTGNVQVLELGGVNPRKTAELYAENIRKIKVFVNLPTLSQLAVTKIYEVAACSTPILTPEVSDMRNLDGLPVQIYRDAKECAELLQAKVFPEPNSPAQLGLGQTIMQGHRLELRCEVLLSALKEVGAKAA
jgi:hypothetical protein